MGKKNRHKSKKLKPSNPLPSETPIEPLIDLNLHKSLQSHKEEFLHQIKNFSNKLLKEFEQSTEIRIETKSKIQIRFNPAKSALSIKQTEVLEDPSGEWLEIFSKIFSNFLNTLISTYRETSRIDPEKSVFTLQDALKVIEIFLQDVSAYSLSIFQLSDGVFKGLCVSKFKNLIQSVPALDDQVKALGFWQTYEHETRQFIKYQAAKSKKSQEEGDLIVENFQRKLDLEKSSLSKARPRLSEEWIADLKKCLKGPRNDLGYINRIA